MRFGTFELDERTGELRRAGHLVTREEIQRELWSGATYVDFERSINICVMQIRAALGDDAETPRFIETLPRRGYRFVAEAARANGAASAGASTDAPLGAPRWRRGRWLVPALALGVVIAAFYAARGRLETVVHAPAAKRVMLAVLPFQNLSGNPELAYVADGMTEELIAQLGRIAPERLGVIARTSAMRYQGARESVTKIGGELGVEYVIEGSVRVEKDRAWITGQLIRVSDQTRTWADTFEMNGASVFTLQDLAARMIVLSVAQQLVPSAESLNERLARGSSNPAAMDAYLQGRYLLHRGGGDAIAKAVSHFERAVAADDKLVDAHASLADALQFGTMIGRFTPEEAAPRARAAAQRALAADASSSDAHAARGLVAMWFDWDPQQAAARFKKALAANPSNAEAHHDYAWALVALNRDEEAVREIQQAQTLDPVSPRANMDIGWLYLGVRRYDDAIRHCTRMVEIEPRVFEAAQSCLETAYLAQGDVRGAAAAAIRQLERNPSEAGRMAELQKLAPEAVLRELWKLRLNQRMSSATRRKAYRAAGWHLQLGEKEKALQYLEQAFAEREMLLVLMHRSPEFDSLRDEPRFNNLLAKIQPLT